MVVPSGTDIRSQPERTQGAELDAKDGDVHHWICAVAVTKKWVSLRFHFGGLLSHPDNVFRGGKSKSLRSIDYVQAADVDGELVGRYVREALSRLNYFKADCRRLWNEE